MVKKVSVEQLDRWYRMLRLAIEIGQELSQTRAIRIAQKERAQELIAFEEEAKAMAHMLGYEGKE